MDRAEARRYATIYTACMEEVAREHAAAIGFDLATEKDGLMRMFMVVFATQELRVEAGRRARLKLAEAD